MRRTLILGALGLPLLLAACSEQQLCISRATKDLRVVRGFMDEAEGNLARGYALVTVTEVDYERSVCGVDQAGQKRYCRVPVEVEKTVPKAIDLDAEAAKLASLRAKEASLAAQAQASVAACQQAYPEG